MVDEERERRVDEALKQVSDEDLDRLARTLAGLVHSAWVNAKAEYDNPSPDASPSLKATAARVGAWYASHPPPPGG